MVERGGLENRCARKGTVSSNLTLAVTDMEWIIENRFFILGGITALGFGILGWFLFILRRKISRIFGDTIPGDVQTDILRRVRTLETQNEIASPRMERMEEVSRTSVQKVGFSRFNPFQDTGGDNSFTLALLDNEDNGVIISSLYMRGGTRLYAKQIERGTPKHPLSDEEQKVLEEAINGKSQ